MQIVEYLRAFNFGSVVLRLLLAMLLGGWIGLEREQKHRPAGFRTYMLVCIGAALAMTISQYLAEYMLIISPETKTDAARLGAQCINGIGFLGAGTIMVSSKTQVKGITTAAGLWASACMGLAIGAGFYECALCAAVIMFLCIKVFPTVERKALAKSKRCNIYVELQNLADVEAVNEAIRGRNIRIESMEFYSQEENEGKHPGVILGIELPKRENHEFLNAMLLEIPSVCSVEEI